MSYPHGNYPGYPPNQGSGAPGLGFGAPNPSGPGYPPQGNPYPVSPAGYPPGGPSSGYPGQPGASPYPPLGGRPGASSGDAPSAYPTPGAGHYPTTNSPQNYGAPSGPSTYASPSAPYAPSGQASNPFGPPGSASGPSTYAQPSGYPSYPGGNYSSPYPNQGAGFPMPSDSQPTYLPSGGSPYPAAAGGNPYTQSSNSPYPPAAGASPYPPTAGASPYPPTAGASPYPPTGASTYPPAQPGPYGQQHSSYSGTPGGVQTPYKPRPTVRPAMGFDPSSDAAALKKAMKGFGTDEKAIIAVLARRTDVQRQQIALKFQQAYGKDLIKDLKKELSGDFESVILALMMPLPVYLATELNKSIKGIGTKERVLIEILATRDNNSIGAIKAAYYHHFKDHLEQHIRDDTSGDFKRIMVSMSTGQRDEHNMDTSQAPVLAQSLYKAGEGKWGTDESEFRRIMAVYSFPVLRCVFQEYQKIKGKSFGDAIKSELSGDFGDAMLALYHSIMNQAAFFAAELHSAMKGMGTKDATLIRIITSRCEIDLGNIKDEYKAAYGKRLEDAVSSETSGDYKKVLHALLQD